MAAERRPEVRRRMEILKRFLAVPKPTKTDRLAARRELGVSRPMFHLLLAAWRSGRRPADLPGSGASRSPRRPGRSASAGSERVIAEAIKAAGPDATGSEVIRLVAERCATAGFARPSAALIRKRLREAANDAKGASGAGRRLFVVEFCALDLPSPDEDPTLPVVAVVVALPEGTISAHQVIWGPPTGHAAIVSLAQAFVAEDGSPPRAVQLPEVADLDAKLLRVVLVDLGLAPEEPAPAFAPGRRFRSLVGETLGGIRLLPGKTLRPIAAPGSTSRRLRRSDVETAVGEAVELQNATRCQRGPPASDGSSVDNGTRAAALLDWLARAPRP